MIEIEKNEVRRMLTAQMAEERHHAARQVQMTPWAQVAAWTEELTPRLREEVATRGGALEMADEIAGRTHIKR